MNEAGPPPKKGRGVRGHYIVYHFICKKIYRRCKLIYGSKNQVNGCLGMKKEGRKGLQRREKHREAFGSEEYDKYADLVRHSHMYT